MAIDMMELCGGFPNREMLKFSVGKGTVVTTCLPTLKGNTYRESWDEVKSSEAE